MPKLRIFMIIAMLFFSTGPSFSQAGEPTFSEYEIKAGFIYNFPKFMEWPIDSIRDEKRPLTLCISGMDPFGSSLSAISSKTAQNRKLEIKELGKSRDFKTCNIVFISSSEKESLPQLIDTLKNSPIVTIGDNTGFAQGGVMINLVMDDDRVKFEINTESARRARIVISSKLLKLAKTIYK
ncbi:MAG TPA: YfiR family protein [Syntrophorhabdaceae bacterium]|nr:YfiR family protein [Syntrophorhabdaceae bacterium]